MNIGDVAVLVCEAHGPPIGAERDALDLIGAAAGERADWIAIPSVRLDADFFRLASGMAGAFLQKMINYGLSVVIVGDLSEAVANSESLAAFVRESNRGTRIWFVADFAAFELKLKALD